MDKNWSGLLGIYVAWYDRSQENFSSVIIIWKKVAIIALFQIPL